MDDSPSRYGRQPAKLPPQKFTRSKPAGDTLRTPWDEWLVKYSNRCIFCLLTCKKRAEAEALETKKWGEDLE